MFSDSHDTDHHSLTNSILDIRDFQPKLHSTRQSYENIVFERTSENSFSIKFSNSESLITENRVDPERNINKIDCKNRGKYVTPCPEINFIHQKPEKSSRFSQRILRNGCHQNRKLINKNYFYFTNTCPFDSILEILVAGYLSSKPFQIFIDSEEKQSNCIFRLLKMYVKEGPKKKVYDERAYMFHAMYSSKNNRIDCEDNASRLFQRLMEKYTAPMENTKCQRAACSAVKIKKKPILDINLKPIWQRGFRVLQEIVEKSIQESSNFHCEICRESIVLKTIDFGVYICIDTEDAYVDLIEKMNIVNEGV